MLARTLLAQAVVVGRAKGYTRHSQLTRFRTAEQDASTVIGAYLTGLADEADGRGYRFDKTRILTPPPPVACLTVTDGQLAYEWKHLLAKLKQLSPEDWRRWDESGPEQHPIFTVVPGPVADWERPSRVP